MLLDYSPRLNGVLPFAPGVLQPLLIYQFGHSVPNGLEIDSRILVYLLCGGTSHLYYSSENLLFLRGFVVGVGEGRRQPLYCD